MALPARRPLTEEEYLAFEEQSKRKHEFVGGYVYAMAGTGERHNLICTNLVAALVAPVRARGCRLYVADMKLRTPDASFYYPDVMVVCDSTDRENIYRTHPCLLVEVLSWATKTVDRREKLVEGRRIPTLRTYLLVDPDERLVQRHWRDESGTWRTDSHEAGAVPLPCLGVEIQLGDVYYGLEFRG